MSNHRFITGRALIKALLDAGVVSENCTHVVIEASVDGVAKVHYSTIGEDNLLHIVPPLAMGPIVREYITNDKGEHVEVTSI